jgi:hypothetical protein
VPHIPFHGACEVDSGTRYVPDRHILVGSNVDHDALGFQGAVAVRLLMDDTSLCFLNCHLAAGHRRVRDRNADAAAIIEHEKLFPESETLGEAFAFVGGGDGTMALDHEIVFVSVSSCKVLTHQIPYSSPYR